VRYWLRAHGHDPADEALVEALLTAVKQADSALGDREAERVVRTTEANCEPRRHGGTENSY
jgi:hypothetical protein